MPKIKMKSNSGAKKRFKLTASGRVKRKRAFMRHNFTHKKKNVKRRLRRTGYVFPTQEHQIKAMLPYGT
jgi:large subunit ribosomal protein L35